MMLVFFLLVGVSVITMEIGLWINGYEMDSGKLYGFGIVTVLSFIMTVFTYRALQKSEAQRNLTTYTMLFVVRCFISQKFCLLKIFEDL